jgi:hypothetical protein
VNVDAGAYDDQVNVFVVCDILRIAISFRLWRKLEYLNCTFRGFDAAVDEGYDLILFSAAGREEMMWLRILRGR